MPEPSRLIKPKIMKKEERCRPCEEQVAGDMALSVCETVGQDKFGVDCKQLRKDAIAGKANPLKIARDLRDIAKRKGLKEYAHLDEIYKMGKGP